MTNYVKATNFTQKDQLPVGDNQKKVKGAEFDVEFDAIATAIESKANETDAALDGTPTAPTAAAATNTTQIATTAFVQAQKTDIALTGTPTAPTATAGTDTTQIATTEFVTAAVDAIPELEYASETTKGGARIYTSGGDLYIYTQD